MAEIKQNKKHQTSTIDTYGLVVKQNKTVSLISVTANDSNHAQAQADDICRAIQATGFELSYGKKRETNVSELFKKLAFNDFTYKECYLWSGSVSNSNPCFYIFNKRFYTRAVILKYLDIPKEDTQIKLTCNCNLCVNPYHFSYCSSSNSKLTNGDLKLLKAYKNEGVKVAQIAELLNVHRGTIYRNFKKI